MSQCPVQARSRRAGDLVRGVAALGGVVVLLVVLPVWALPRLGWPLPRGVPSAGGALDALAHRGVSFSVVLRSAAAVLWAAWAVLSVCVVIEAAAWARRREARAVRGLGGVQRLACNLVATAVVVLPSLSRLAAPAVAPTLSTASAPATTMVAAPAPLPPVMAPDAGGPPGVGPRLSVAGGPKPYVVQRYDCLWTVAERHLGDPLRWPEIEVLTDPLPQPDGRHLGDPNLIYPGWTLLLPPDAVGLVEPTGTPSTAPAPPPPAPGTLPAGPEAPAPAPSASAAASDPSVPATAATTSGRATSSQPANPSAPAPARAGGRARGPRPAAPVVAVTAAVGVSSLLGGIYVWRMRREAMAAQRRRRRGRELVQPDPQTELVERRVRAIAAEETVHWVDATLRYLSAVLAESDGAGVEGVVCVRPGRLGMEVVVEPPVPPVGRFDSADGGRTWTLDPDMDLAELADLAWGQVLVPALCSLGTSADGPVLVDLEFAGVLAVEGDPIRVEGFLAAAALELASAPWTNDTAVYLLGGDERLANRDLVEVVADARAFAAGVGRLCSLVGDDDLGAAPSTLAARVSPGNVEGWYPTVVVAGPGTEDATLAAIAQRARPRRSGLALLAPGPLAGATWRLVLGSDGVAVMEPLGITVDARVDVDVVAALAGRLGARTERVDIEPVIDLAPRTVAPLPPDAPGPGEEPIEGEVRILGPVEVTWATTNGTAPDRASQLAAIVAYLGAHADHPVPGPRLQEAIWPLSDDDDDIRAGSVTDKTLRATVSRARKALGTDSLGRNHLPAARAGTYALGPRFSCDWWRFRQLVDAARTASSAEAIELLREALGLVRGRPFENAHASCFAWADDSPLVSDIEVAVTSAAEELGERALEAGKPELAAWAARQGLRVVPVREDLYRLRMQAAFDAGDADGIDQAHTEAIRAVRVYIDLAEPLQDETERLYQRLRRACRTAGVQQRPLEESHRA